MIYQADRILKTTDLPQGRAQRASELLTAALSLADVLLKTPPAAALGKNGGEKFAERGPEYSPAEVASTEVVPVIGDPDPKRICTSIVERQNLTMRMQIRRLARLTNGFSKKWENLWAALCLHFAYYNFCRTHRSLRVTPAMEAGIADHVWTVAELLS